MITVNFNGHEISVRDELFDRSETLRLVQKTRSDVLYIYDVLDRLIEGGSVYVQRILYPEIGDPHVSDMGAFVEKLFLELPELKNSTGSQSLSDTASQRLEQTYNDATRSTSMTFTPIELR